MPMLSQHMSHRFFYLRNQQMHGDEPVPKETSLNST